jgi:uroporphyrinogen-III synthase
VRLIVTRPQAQADALVAELRAAGVDAVALPLIDIAPVVDDRPLRDAWASLHTRALVMFVSANAVQHFMRWHPPSAAWPPQLLAGSTGPGTSAALRDAGVPQALLVEPAGQVFDSEALWQQLRTRDWQGRRVLVVRGEGGRDWLADQLRERGATVDFVAVYRRCPPQLDEAARALIETALAQPLQHLWAISSSEAVAHLAGLAPQADWHKAAAVAPHPRIVQALQQLGFGQVRQAPADAAALAAVVWEGRPIQSAAP